ncbi:MAG: hypothetical protein HQK54_15065 [Oligoflexales bacterium]|nr:hypothetical protein [Oligoflexales bacterium]
MSSQLITYLGYLLAAVFAFFSFVTYRKFLRLKALFSEAATRLQIGQKSYDELVENEKKLNLKLEQSRVMVLDLEKIIEDGRSKYSKQSLELQDLRTKFESQLEKLTRERDHLAEESEVLMKQVKEADLNLRKLSSEGKEQSKKTGADQQELKEKFDRELSELRKQFASIEKEKKNLAMEVDKLRDILKKVDPKIIQRSKQKVKEMEQLYCSMKGLREMAEERNQNWEVALRKFAEHILEKPCPDKSIGPLVGEALEKIGCTLVHDEISEAEFRERRSRETPAVENAGDIKKSVSSPLL